MLRRTSKRVKELVDKMRLPAVVRLSRSFWDDARNGTEKEKRQFVFRQITLMQVECADAAPGCQRCELPENELQLFSGCAIAGVLPETPAQADNGRQAHLVHYLFDSLRGPSQHDRPASRPSPAPVLSRNRNGSQSSSKGVSGEQQWLRLCSLPRGARPLLLLIIFLA